MQYSRTMVDRAEEELHETLVESEQIYDGSYIGVRRETVTDANGERRTREVVLHPGAIAVVPLLADGRVLLVRQYRHPVGLALLEVPAGTLDSVDNGQTESPDEAAPRELAEETGHVAARWRKLGRFFTAPGFTTEEMHLYLATELTPIEGYGGPAADELLRLETLHWREALAAAQSGELRDAKTLVAIFWLAHLVESGQLPELARSEAG